MAAIPAIVELLQEVLNGLGVFKARRMFGGHGLYLDGTFFAILDDGVLFFKVSDATRSAYEAEGMGPFTYQTKTGEHALNSYWRLPERLLDEPGDMREWVRAAVHAAQTSKARQSKAKVPRPGKAAKRAGKRIPASATKSDARRKSR